MSQLPTTERIQVEVAVAMSIREQYGTNQPDKTYEDGVADALLWVLGGKEPQNHAEHPLLETNQSNIFDLGANHAKQHS